MMHGQKNIKLSEWSVCCSDFLLFRTTESMNCQNLCLDNNHSIKIAALIKTI